MPNALNIQFVWLLEPVSSAISSRLCAIGSTAFDTPRLTLWSSHAGPCPPVHFKSSVRFMFTFTYHSTNSVFTRCSSRFYHHRSSPVHHQLVKCILCTSSCAGPCPPVHFQLLAHSTFAFTCRLTNGVFTWLSPPSLRHRRTPAHHQLVKHVLCTWRSYTQHSSKWYA